MAGLQVLKSSPSCEAHKGTGNRTRSLQSSGAMLKALNSRDRFGSSPCAAHLLAGSARRMAPTARTRDREPQVRGCKFEKDYNRNRSSGAGSVVLNALEVGPAHGTRTRDRQVPLVFCVLLVAALLLLTCPKARIQ